MQHPYPHSQQPSGHSKRLNSQVLQQGFLQQTQYEQVPSKASFAVENAFVGLENPANGEYGVKGKNKKGKAEGVDYKSVLDYWEIGERVLCDREVSLRHFHFQEGCVENVLKKRELRLQHEEANPKRNQHPPTAPA